jgi:hypothetical protein
LRIDATSISTLAPHFIIQCGGARAVEVEGGGLDVVVAVKIKMLRLENRGFLGPDVA